MRITKCVNGLSKKIITKFFNEKCDCIHRKIIKDIKCPCPKSKTIRKPCKKKDRKVITIYYVRIGRKCKSKRKIHEEICEKQPKWTPKYACQCYHYGAGNILTYDKRRLLASTKGKCSILLSTWVNTKSDCSFKLFTITEHGKFVGQMIYFKDSRYLLGQRKQLYINGKLAIVPHSEKHLRIFFSGEYLQLVSPKCNLAIAYNGHGGGYISVGVVKGHNFKGLCGNCNGNPIDDKMIKAFTGGKNCQTLSGFKNMNICLRKYSNQIRHKYCGRLTGFIRSNFFKCKSMAFHFHRGCIKDVCTEWPNVKKMIEASCKVHSMAAEACSEKNIYFHWRTSSFCPMKCGENKVFVAKMNPCPKTCENHFFETSRRCFKLPHRNGCECKRGFVLDGNQCVTPSQCRCLDKICVDRFAKSKCLKWMNEGRCTKYPELMSEFCRVTCNFCSETCEDQVSSRVCGKVKKAGKCTLDFYKQMCRLTCFPESCKCPDCETEEADCHLIYKYKIKKKTCYKLNRHGTCLPLVTRNYEKCGVCPTNVKNTRTKCDFCKGHRWAISTTYFRDQSHKQKCKSTATKVKEPCLCRNERGSFIKCVKDKDLIKTTYQYGNSKCQKCVKRTFSKILKVTECRGSWITRSHCNRKFRTRFVTFHKSVASNCKCSYSSRKIEILCKCPNIKNRKPVCEDNYWTFYQIGYTMESRKKCKKFVTKSVKPVICNKSMKIITRCDKKTCQRTQYLEKWIVEQCQCRLTVKRSLNGKCCCPKEKVSVSMCLGYYIVKKKIKHLLINHKCIMRIFQKKLRCRCPSKKAIKYCSGRKGLIIRGYIKFHLTKPHTCRKQTIKSALPVLCRKVHVKHVSPCGHFKRHSKEKYRKITFTSLIREGCKCIEKHKSYLEPCGCKHKKRHQIIPCPMKCKLSKHCSPNCFKIKKWFIYRFAKYGMSKKCIRNLYKIEKKRCCCKKNSKKFKKCIKGKYIQTKISQNVLMSGKCSREHKEVFLKVNCPVGFLKKLFGKKIKGRKQTITNVHGFISHCKCRTRFNKKLCPWRCSKPTIKKYCNKLKNSVIKKIYYQVLRGCKCIKKMKIEKMKIFCPQYIRKLKTKCLKHSKYGEIVFEKSFQNGCNCRKMKIKKKKLCNCPKSVITGPICKGKHLIKQKFFYKLAHKKCVRFSKSIRIPLNCSKKVKFFKKCSKISGKFIKYKIFQILKHCKCFSKKKVIQIGDCHCKHKIGKKFVKCDLINNQWLHINFGYFLNSNNKKCQKTKIVKKRPVYCHKKVYQRKRCNLVAKKRRIIKIFYKRKHCKCIKRKTVIYQHCGCPKFKSIIKKFCDKQKGHFVTVIIYKKWKEEANKCLRIIKRKVEPIYCNHGIRLYKSKCNGKYYSEKLVKKFKNNKTCSCEKRIRQKKRNCHCPTKVIKKKCKKQTGYIGKKIIIFKEWNSHTKKCHISNRKTFYHRCKCPKSIFRKFCFKGKWIEKSTKYNLENKRCIKIKKQKKYKIFCRKSSKKIVGKCNKHSCTKNLVNYSQYLDEKKCRCVWRKSSVRKCKCCGCPKKSVKTHCYKHKYFRTRIIFFIGKEGKCSYKCFPHHKIIKRKFKCKIQLPKPHWTKCNKSECQKRLVKWKVIIKNCKCIKKRIFGPKKTCCCPYKPKKKTFCKNGKIVTREKHIKLRHHKCKPWYKKSSKKIKCKKFVKMFSKKCNKKTCRKSIFIKTLSLDHKKCKCRMKIKFLHYQPCCCKKKPRIQKYCNGECLITKRVKYVFHSHKKSCIKKTKISKKCIRCPKQQKISSTCNKKTCLKFNYKYRFYVDKCKCLKQVIKSAKVCCCPKPTPWSKMCIKNHYVFKKKYFKLHHGKCVKRIKIRKEKVYCKMGSIKSVKHMKCNRKTCMKMLLIYKRHQKGCKCEVRKIKSYKKCCCPPPTYKTVCKNHKKIMKLSKTWHLRKHKCVIHKQSYLKEEIDMCKNKKIVGKCNKKSKTRIIKIIVYEPRNCKCKPVKRIIKKLLCSCPLPKKFHHKCDKRTCIKTDTFIYFVGPIKHKKCHRKVRKNSFKCCCIGKQKWTKKRCDRQSGNKEIHFFKKIFNHKMKTCQIIRKIKVIKTKCPKSVRKHANKCEKSTGYRSYIKYVWKKDYQKCRCRKVTLAKKKLCSCSHKKCVIHKPKCIFHGFLEKKKICYRKRKSKCVKIVKLLHKKIVCPHKKQIKHKCSQENCVGKKITKMFFEKHCKCVPKVHIENYTCCCPKPSKTVKCKNDSFEVTHIRYKFNKYKKSCKKIVVKKSKIIKCNSSRLRTMKCDQRNCNKSKHIKHYKLVNCKCKLMKKQKILRKCCCPKNKSKLKCYHKYGVMQHVQYKYRLHKGTCVVQKLVEQDKISCNRPKIIRSKCNKKTKKRTIKIISHRRIGCKCKSFMRTTQTLCACKKPRIVKGKCKNKLETVYLIEYALKKLKHSKKCLKTVMKLHTDPCICPRPKKSRKCKYNQIQIRTIHYTLKHRKKRKFCHMKDVIRYKRIKCPRKKHVKTKCKNFKFKIITIFYQLKKCKCFKKTTVKVQACQCYKRNKHFSYCSDGVVFNVVEKYYSTKGIMHCLMHSIFKTKSIVCKKNKRSVPLSRKCNKKRNYGLFKEYLITWNKQVGCKCKKLSKKITKLCRCFKNIKKVKCIADDTLKIYKMTVTKVKNHCLPKQEITTRDIQCIGKERDVKYYPCAKYGKHKCFQKIKITEKWVENCKCKSKTVVVQRLCCVPKSIKVKFCDRKLGQNVQKTTIFKLTLGKLLYRKEDFIIQDKKLIKSKIFQKQAVFCPSKSIVEKCNRKSGKWIRKITSYKRYGCHCKKFVKNIGGKCKCPHSREIISKCKNEFQSARTIMYQLIDKHCVRFSQVKKQRCSCPQPVHRIYCDGEGRWVKCLTEFNFSAASHTCSLEKRCVRWDQACPDPYRIDGKCNKHSFKRRNSDVSFSLNEEKCNCEKSIEYSSEYCTCKHMNKKESKCFDGVRVIMKTTFTLKKGQCLPTRIKIKKRIDCPHPIKRAMKCNRNKHSKKPGYRLIKLTTFHNEHCKCIKRVRAYYVPCDCKLLHKPINKTFCKNHSILMSHIFYRVLLGKKCLKRTKYLKKDIICSNKRKIEKGKCRKSKKSEISYKTISVFHQVTKNCKCIWKIKKHHKQICKCPPKRKSIHCVEHHIIRRVTTIFAKHFSLKKCMKRSMIREQRVKCQKKWKVSKCKKSSCTLYINKYSQKPVNCKCVTTRKLIKRKCCCPKPTKRKTVCLEKQNMFLTSWFTFKLMDKYCVKKKRFSSTKIHCERKAPKIRMGKCVNHHRTVYIISKKNHKCRCIEIIKRIRERCDCPKKIKLNKGKCIGKFAKDKWSALKFDSNSKKCIRQIFQVRIRRCKCPTKQKNMKCFHNEIIIFTKTKFVLKTKTNSCEKIVSKFNHHIACSVKPRLIKVRKSKCSKHTGYYVTTKKTYKVAKKCKCFKYTRKFVWPCNCNKLHPPRKMIKCVKGKFIMKIIKQSFKKNKKCKSKITKKIQKINCFGKKKKFSKCNRKTKKKTIFLFKKTTLHCQCKWKLVKKIRVLCACPKPKTKIKCAGGKYFIKTKTTFYLRHHKCIVKHNQINFNINCNTGLKIKISKCDAFSGYKTIKKIITTINKCQCFKQISRKKCRCKCPKPMKYTICIRRTGHFKTTKVIHKLKKCNCFSKRNVSMLKLNCPKSKVIVTPCKVASKKHDKYKSIVKIMHHRDGCKCIKTIKKIRVLCSCSSMVKKLRKCVKNKYKLTTITKRIKNHGKCKRVEIDNDKLEIECPENETKKHCNKKTGKETIIILKWHRKDCKCISRKLVRKRNCKCKSGLKLVHSLKCNKKCYKVKVFKYETLINYHCKPKYIAKRKMCCCPKLVNTKSQCLQNIGMIEITKRSLKLHKGKCIHEYSKKKKVIHCPKKKTKKVHKLPKGVIKIILFRIKRVGCKCKTSRKILFRSWTCPKSRKTTKCVDAPESSKETVTVTYKMMPKSTECKKLVVVHREPTECEPDRTFWTKCQLGKHGYYKTLIQISYSAKHCKCYKSIDKTIALCKCDKPIVKKFCDKSKSRQVQIITHFVPDTRTHKHCVPVVSKQQFKVLCNEHFKFSRKTKCSKKTSMLHIIFKAEKLIGCHCKKVYRRKSCRCKCPKTKVVRKCRHDNVREKIITQWILIKCFCKKVVSSHLESIKCPGKTKSHLKCGSSEGKCKKRIISTSYKSQHCQCKKIRRIFVVKCCCPKARKLKKCYQGRWITKSIFYSLKNGHCFRRSKQKSRHITCSTEKIVQMIGPCKGKKQKYLLTSFTRTGCKCVKKFKKFFRNCLCLKKSAAEVIFLVDQTVSSRNGQYQNLIRKLLRDTVNVFPIGKSSYRFALVKYSENPSVVFNLNDHHGHHSIFSSINKLPYIGKTSNIAKAFHLTRTQILKNSRPGVLRLIFVLSDGLNDKNMKSAYREIYLLNKMHVRLNVVAIKPSKDGKKFLKKLLVGPKSHMWFVHKKLNLKNLPQKILRTICKKACPVARVKHTKCSKETGCYGKTYIYGYKFAGKQCVRKVTTKTWFCCCPKPMRKFEICMKNRKYLVIIKWKFHHKTCVKHIKKKDISADLFENCKPKHQQHVGHCDSSNYRLITTIKRTFQNCLCVKSFKKQMRICRCSKSKRFKECQKNKFIVSIKLYETFKKHKCIKRRSMSKIPIVCSKPKILKSKCDRITCTKTIRFIKFFVNKCQCHHKTFSKTIKCCCPSTKRIKRFCEFNKKIYYENYMVFDSKMKTCIKKSIKKKREINCPSKPNIHVGKCNIPLGKVWYKLKTIRYFIKKNCKCIKMMQNSKIPCRCSSGPVFKKCTKGNIWKKFSIVYKLLKIKRGKHNIGRCKKQVKVIGEKKHKCKRKHRKSLGKCKKYKSSSEKYRTIKITWIVQRECKCVKLSKYVKKLCQCPRGQIKKKCVKDKYLVTFKTWFEMKGSKQKSKCLMKSKEFTKKIHCPKPIIRQLGCKSKHGSKKYNIINTILHLPRKCRCLKKRYVRKVKCDHPKMGNLHGATCIDVLPRKICRKVKFMGGCKKHSDYRKKLCRETCDQCSSCPKNSKIAFKIKYHSCLVTDRRFKRKLNLATFKMISYHLCMMKCKQIPSCKSFDFYIRKEKKPGFCVLNKVNPSQLEAKIYPHQIKIGATDKDLQKHKASHCILNVKICKNICQSPKVKKLGKCHCTKIKHRVLCSRKSHIIYFVVSHNGHCLKRFWKGLIPCHSNGCNNWKSDGKCKNLKLKGKCSNKIVKKICKKECTKCKCSKSIFYTTKCDKSHHKYKIKIFLFKHEHHGKCIMKIIKEKQSCNVCYKKPFRVVHKCKNSVRYISTVQSIKLKNGKCKVVASNKVYSCSKCPKHDQQFVTSCNKSGHLKLITKYSIREKGCCRFKIESRKFYCKNCPQRKIRKTRCSEGYRLRHVIYYVKFNRNQHNKQNITCKRRTYTKKEKCHSTTVCQDEMSNIDCKLFMKSNGCHKNEADAYKLCRASCGLC